MLVLQGLCWRLPFPFPRMLVKRPCIGRATSGFASELLTAFRSRLVKGADYTWLSDKEWKGFSCTLPQYCRRTYIPMYIPILCTYLPIYIHTYVHTYLCIHIPMYKDAYVHTYAHTYLCTYVCTNIPIYKHTYVHTYIHMYIHIYADTYI